ILHPRFRVLTKWCKYLRLSIQLKTHRCNTHDFVRLSTKNQRFTYSRRPSTVSALPQAVANDDYRCRPALVFFRAELPPRYEIDAQHGEQLGRDLAAVDVLCLSRFAHRISAITPCRQMRERATLPLEVEKVGV